MALISITTPNDGESIDASDVANPLNTIVAEINGNLDANNLAASAVTTAKIATSAVETAKIADNAVTNAKVAVGAAVQYVYANYSDVDTTQVVMPADDSIPQITEGKEFMSLAITPKSTTNILVIRVHAFVAIGTSTTAATAGLFQDSTANAIAGDQAMIDTSANVRPIVIEHSMVAGTTSATTFSVRIGPNVTATLTFNGRSSARLLGAIPKSSITITEYKAS